MRTPLVLGNWKMHGSLAANLGLLHGIRAGVVGAAEVGVCVPFPYLAQARSVLAGSAVTWGAQDVSQFDAGAYTGEVSADMLADFGCRYVLVGHSERRQLFGESDAVVAAKVLSALRKGLRPVVCVGETLQERESGATFAVVLRQMEAVISRFSAKDVSRLVWAYEPVWAIGTGRTASVEQAQEVHAVLRSRLTQVAPETAQGSRILYGGSVKAANAAALFCQPDIDGGLIGGASLQVNEFLAICAAVC